VSSQDDLFRAGVAALKQQQPAEAVRILTAYCDLNANTRSKELYQAKMYLVKAYQDNGELDRAIDLCHQMTTCGIPAIQAWAEQRLPALRLVASSRFEPAGVDETPSTELQANVTQGQSRQSGVIRGSKAPRSPASARNQPPDGSNTGLPKAGRSAHRGVAIPLKGMANLTVASGLTLTLLVGMVFSLILAVTLIQNSKNPLLGLGLSVGLTVAFSTAMFFLSPLIMDMVQGWLYKTRWTDLTEIERLSPETARVLREVCQKHNIKQPRLGIIDDQNPTAFTYGALPNSARLVVSRGLFSYLDDDEVATVYAHELGHIVHWDFAVMTLASTLVQVTYLIYIYAREAGKVSDKAKDFTQYASIVAYVFYLVGEFVLLYLSRVREYHADHFAASVTGNPNALSRALVKIAYGILTEAERNPEPSRLIQGTRALGICDPRSAPLTGTAYRVAAEPLKVGRVFLWDMFNPWAFWMELGSTHPLTGKRVRALSNYAEQLGLDTEFDFAQVVREGKTLNKGRLYGSFMTDILLMNVQLLAGLVGLIPGILVAVATGNPLAFFAPILVLVGIATLAKMFVSYPNLSQAADLDIIDLMSDPYASPLRGKPVKLKGKVIGRGDAGSKLGSDVKLQDKTGMMQLHYSSRWGPIGNALFGYKQVAGLIDQDAQATGWFRRGVASWVDLAALEVPGKTVRSYHKFWEAVLGGGAILLGLLLLAMTVVG
jgi:Zn-dependent protease with chaperone function